EALERPQKLPLPPSQTSSHPPLAHYVLGDLAPLQVSPPGTRRTRMARIQAGGRSRDVGGALKSSAGAVHDQYRPYARGSSRGLETDCWHGVESAQRPKGRETARKFPQYSPTQPQSAGDRKSTRL